MNLDVGLFRRFQVTERFSIQFRAKAFNVTNTPHLSNSDGTFQSGVFEVTGVNRVGREGIDERVFRFGIRLGF